MTRWRWVDERVALAIHDEQLAEHGGAAGLRDLGLLQSALARPRHLAANARPDAADLAAAHAFGLVRNHAFIDGNKRTALVVSELFLDLNGYEVTADDAACVAAMLALAEGVISEREHAAWLRRHLRRRK
jgi:death-on-curing protein